MRVVVRLLLLKSKINNYNINLENVIINSDTVNISHSTNLLDLSAIEKLLKNGLYDDAKKTRSIDKRFSR